MGRIAGQAAVSSKVKLLVVKCETYDDFAKKANSTFSELEKVKLWNRRSEFKKYAETLKTKDPVKVNVTQKASKKSKPNTKKHGKTDLPDVVDYLKVDSSIYDMASKLDAGLKEAINLLKVQNNLMQQFLENDKTRMELVNQLRALYPASKKKDKS
jgi:hypothetical protein